MGAKTAMLLALNHPDLVSALIAVDNSPVDVPLKSNFHAYVTGMRQISRSAVKKQSEADQILKSFAPQPAVRQFLLTNLQHIKDSAGNDTLAWRIPLEGLAKGLDHMGDFPSIDSAAKRYKGPTLVVRGTRSPYVPDEVLPVFGAFFPRFTCVDVDAGHWVISEKPEEFRRAVVEFLEDQN
jgi:pimeloyl-ACP methyl ester carboxylesterase